MKNKKKILALLTAGVLAVSAQTPRISVYASEPETGYVSEPETTDADETGTTDGSESDTAEVAASDTAEAAAPDTADAAEPEASAESELNEEAKNDLAENDPADDTTDRSNTIGQTGTIERQMILIGDSRTVHMHEAVGDDGQIWSCKGAIGQAWMKGVGVPAVERYIGADTNVVILMGVNDAWEQNTDVTTTSYADYLNSKAEKWTEKGANVFFVSVNPIREDWGSSSLILTNSAIDEFNMEMDLKLSDKVHFIDTNSEISGSAGFVDQLHYDTATNEKIYSLIKEECAKYKTNTRNENRTVGDFSNYYYASNPEEQTVKTINMYRLYNPNSGEHFYTAIAGEKEHLVSLGWRDEGTGWKAPVTSKTPVYRVYNPNSGLHHYTMNEGEKNQLVSLGWNDEGIGWYSDDCRRNLVYRQYNPNSGQHNYTLRKQENDYLVSLGWRDESYGWFGA